MVDALVTSPLPLHAGTREHIRYLVEHRMVDALVTTAGGIEEDFIKCLADTYVGDFALKGAVGRHLWRGLRNFALKGAVRASGGFASE